MSSVMNVEGRVAVDKVVQVVKLYKVPSMSSSCGPVIEFELSRSSSESHRTWQHTLQELPKRSLAAWTLLLHRLVLDHGADNPYFADFGEFAFAAGAIEARNLHQWWRLLLDGSLLGQRSSVFVSLGRTR